MSSYLYGHGGAVIGSREGAWLFAEDGNPIGHVVDGHIYRSDGSGPIGSFTREVLYDGNTPIAVGENPKLTMLPPLQPRLNPMPERLVPYGQSVIDVGPTRLKQPFDQYSLANSLKQFGQQT